MPVALSKLKDTYDLQNVENKQFFPHYFNKELNYGTTIETLPKKEFYGMSFLK